MHINPRRVVPVVILLVGLAAAVYWYIEIRPTQAGNGALSASGTIEAAQAQISPELSGKIAAVLVGEGESVQEGQELVLFDTALLTAQLEQARRRAGSGAGELRSGGRWHTC